MQKAKSVLNVSAEPSHMRSGHHSSVQSCLQKQGLHGRVIRKPHKNRHGKHAKHLQKHVILENGGRMKIKLRIACQLFSLGEEIFCFSTVCNPLQQTTLHRYEDDWIALKYRTVWMRQSCSHSKKIKINVKLKRDRFPHRDEFPKHTFKIQHDLLKETQAEALEWPSQSPELKNIQSLWVDILNMLCVQEGINISQNLT